MAAKQLVLLESLGYRSKKLKLVEAPEDSPDSESHSDTEVEVLEDES